VFEVIGCAETVQIEENWHLINWLSELSSLTKAEGFLVELRGEDHLSPLRFW
jgi:hypothetical protein